MKSYNKICILGADYPLGKWLSMYFESPINVFDNDLKNSDLINELVNNPPRLIINARLKNQGIHIHEVKSQEILADIIENEITFISKFAKSSNTNYLTVVPNCVYGSGGDNLKEDNLLSTSPTGATTNYAIGKRFYHNLTAEISRIHGAKSLTLITPAFYGPYDNFTSESQVIPSLIKKFIEAREQNKTVEIWGNGTAVREFIYIEDLAKIVNFFADSKWDHDIINIGSSQCVTIAELAKIISKQLEFAGEFNFNDGVTHGVNRKTLSINRFLSYNYPSSSITEMKHGLAKTIEWYKKYEKSSFGLR